MFFLVPFGAFYCLLVLVKSYREKKKKKFKTGLIYILLLPYYCRNLLTLVIIGYPSQIFLCKDNIISFFIYFVQISAGTVK